MYVEFEINTVWFQTYWLSEVKFGYQKVKTFLGNNETINIIQNSTNIY